MTPREHEVMLLVCDGLSIHEIAARLHISPHTVKSHLKSVSRHLNARNGKHAVALYIAATR